MIPANLFFRVDPGLSSKTQAGQEEKQLLYTTSLWDWIGRMEYSAIMALVLDEHRSS
jgi:hypothetical protein